MSKAGCAVPVQHAGLTTDQTDHRADTGVGGGGGRAAGRLEGSHLVVIVKLSRDGRKEKL